MKQVFWIRHEAGAWTVTQRGRTLSWTPTEAMALTASLSLARNAARNGDDAEVRTARSETEFSITARLPPHPAH